MTNPWSRENFDLDRQKEIVHRGDYRELNRLLLDAGWTPEQAHSFILQMVHAKTMMDEANEIDEFVEAAQERVLDGVRRAIESHEREEKKETGNSIFVASRHSYLSLENAAIFLAVVVLGLWLMA
jgi:hypothetical protein